MLQGNSRRLPPCLPTDIIPNSHDGSSVPQEALLWGLTLKLEASMVVANLPSMYRTPVRLRTSPLDLGPDPGSWASSLALLELAVFL